MKVKARRGRVKWTTANCGCCAIVHRKARLRDNAIIQEALEEISNTLDCEAV